MKTPTEILNRLEELENLIKAWEANADYSINLGIATATEKLQREAEDLRRQNRALLTEQAHEEEVRRTLQAQVERLVDARDAETLRAEQAEKACAEMRGPLEACDTYLAGACQPINRAKIRHALSTDCGKGYIHVSEMETTIAILQRYARNGNDAERELQRLEALKGK